MNKHTTRSRGGERARPVAAAFASLALLSACGGGGGGGAGAATPTTPTPPTTPTDPTQARPQTKDCPNAAVITAITPSAGLARMGSVFSKTLYDPGPTDVNNTHEPQKLQVRVTLDGKAQAGCNVAWQPRSGDASGWVFPDGTVSDANGYVSAWWTAGTATSQALDVSIQGVDGTVKSVAISGTASGHTTRANSIHLSWSTPAWDKFSAEVTPITWEPTTYYEVIGINGGYTGIQSHQRLFSLWDVNGVSPEVIDPGISKCSNFGGEGTGIKCESAFVPKTNVAYRFEMEVAAAPNNKQDYTVFFTDPTDGLRQKLATMRLPRPQTNSGAYGFVEDWSTEAGSCLANKPRAAYFGNVKYLDKASGAWVDVKTAKGTAVYTPTHNEVCANYQHIVENGKFRLSTGGMAVGRPLNLPGDTKQTPMSL
ncbi:DUF3472 domain-containing protein [Pelomonas sp. SE-A7]|uniref:DUF3472 domain-containing protein n=1 Tax=Pelomonas sp. SE-A7 TaxID=3054953 RepID=UPI00259CFB8F|nr:DUF3472 domain-containing protein [Pelomonas sp. SE-A7]MDM4767663.1 DUF3472 domain-containing protein [Pelomonas sp. SE-A7]